MTAGTAGLAALERQVARELDILAYPAAPWVHPHPDAAVLDCAVIGAGQFGLAIGALLRRECVPRIALFDAAPAGQEGPWGTYARMDILRTPKDLSGPELGIPALSFRAYWEAQHGAAGWEALFRVPRTAWADYLAWFRRVADLPVLNQWRLLDLAPAPCGTLLRLRFATPGGQVERLARSVALATGPEGSGGHAIPPDIAAAVPADRVVHALDPIDPARFRGLRLGVLGAGASAFDLAVAALREGATRAEVAVRRPVMPRDNPRRWMENAGFLAHYVDLPDAAKWAYALRLREIGQGPPQPTFDAAMALPGFALRTGFPWDSIRWEGGEIHVAGNGRSARYDMLGIATGFQPGLERRPELAAIAAVAARWRDRYAPPPGAENPGLGAMPYLDRCGGFTQRVPGEAPWLGRVFTLFGTCGLSLGPIAASVSAMKYVTPRLVEGVKRRLFLDQSAQDWDVFLHGEHAELRPFTLPEDDAA
ncbi:MAG: FAD/NAD(P)-binding protein [Paracraurococcus sp.]